MSKQDSNASKLKDRMRATKERFQIISYDSKYEDQVVDICVESYFNLSPLYQDLKMDVNLWKDSIRKQVQDTRCHSMSFLVIDKENNNELVGVKIIRDFASLPRECPKVEDIKMQFLYNLQYRVFANELSKGPHQWGEVATTLVTAIHPKVGKYGIGYLTTVAQIKMLYEQGYKRDVSTVFNLVASRMYSKLIGTIESNIDLRPLEVAGEKCFANNNDGAQCYVSDFDDATISKVLGNPYIKKVKQQQRKKQLREFNNNYQMMHISPKL